MTWCAGPVARIRLIHRGSAPWVGVIRRRELVTVRKDLRHKLDRKNQYAALDA